ncbi:hypothetical protein ACFL27_04745 [candidate division CSSED10-310 bacterium]|uniref:Uncharacterized protein n=1 Tax=candidate division CSSED10-310 bacterium TaxID=2855610 RepID=A0ABV6YTH2_UNCC1
MNRKLFTLKAYAHFLKLKAIEGAWSLPFDDLSKCGNGYRQRPDQVQSSNWLSKHAPSSS